MWDETLARLAIAYGKSEDEVTTAVYSIAEQVHQHYCLSRGIVNHNEARPDQHVALSILGSLAGQDWWLVRAADRQANAVKPVATEAGEPFTHFGDDTVLGWGDDTTKG